MSHAYYMRDGQFLYNNRPLRKIAEPGTPGAKMLKLLADGEIWTAAAVAEHLKVKLYIARHNLARLAERGMVERLENPIRYRRKP